MPTTLFQALSSFPGKVYGAMGEVIDTLSGRRAERLAERNQSDLVEFFSEKLVSAFRAGRVRLLPYYDNLTAETPEHRLAYRWLLKEPAIKSAFMGKLLAVMSLDLQVDPATETPRDKEIASFVEHTLRQCKGGTAEIAWSILFGALLEGNGLSEKVWGRVQRGKYRGRPAVVAIKSKDSKDYQISIDEFNNPTMVISRRTAEEFPMTDFLFWSHMAAFSNPAGMSDLRAVYRAGWMLDTVWKLRAIGLERFTLPVFMSKYPMGRNDIRDSINEAVKKAKALGYLTVPQEAAVEAVEMASKSGSDFDAAIKGLQEECFIAIQGATLQALAGNVSDGRGSSSVHKSTSELFVWYLSVAVAQVVNDQLVPDIVDINYDDAEYPSAWLGGVNDTELKAALDIDVGLLNLGLIQDPKDLARRYRRQMAKNPQEALETLKLIKQLGAPPQPPPMGGMGGGGMLPPPPGDGGASPAMPEPGGMSDDFFGDGGSEGENPFDGSFQEFDERDWGGPITGTHGGTFWVNRKTGEKVYQKENPGGSAKNKPAEEVPGAPAPAPVQQAKPETPKVEAKPWAGRGVEDVLSRPHKDMNPMWFHDQEADSKPFMKLQVTQKPDGTYDAILQDKEHPHLQSHVSSGKGAEDTMNNIWRAGVLPHPQGEEMRRIVVDGINKESKKPAPAPQPAETPKAANPLTKGKAADRLRPKPDDWGAPVIPGSTHTPKWNIATSTGYKRAKPLIDEARRLHADPSKATPEEVRALAQQIASTTGRDALYTLAAAVGIKGGSAKSIAERIVAPLTKEEMSLPDHDPTKEAALIRKVKETGATPAEAKQVTSYARQLRDDGNKTIDRKNAAIKTAFETMAKLSGRRVGPGDEAFKTGDHTQLPRFDEVASSVASEYPDLFPDSFEASQAVYELMKDGPDRRLTINDTFDHAFDEWDRDRKGRKDSAVPFAEKGSK